MNKTSETRACADFESTHASSRTRALKSYINQPEFTKDGIKTECFRLP